MITVFKDKNKKVTVTTQQYSIGLYIAVYTEGDSTPVQFGTSLMNAEEEYHLKLRKNLKGNYLKRQSTIIPVEKLEIKEGGRK